MQIRIPCNIKLRIRSWNVQFTAIWTAGLLIGTLFAAGLDPSFFSLMHRFYFVPVSIVIRLIFAVLPFLICTYAFMIRRHEIVLAVLFCKAFSFSVLAFSASMVYGSAAWLIQPMFQFSDLLLMPVLFWFSIRNGKSLMRDHVICIGTVISAVLIHYYVVLPFVAELIDFKPMGR